MQSYSKVIKYSNINGDAIISPPVFKIETKKQDEHKDDNKKEAYSIHDGIIKEAKEEARNIIKDAKFTAEKMIKETEEKIKEIYKNTNEKAYNDGYLKGYQEGYRKGMEEASNQAEELKKNAENYIRTANEEVKKYLKEKENEIIKLSVDIARTIIKSELSINPEAIFNIAKNVISKSIDKSQIIVKINPKDITLLKQRKEELELFVENPNDLVFLADESIEEGNVYAETPSGFIDGRVDTQLETLIEKLLRNDFNAGN